MNTTHTTPSNSSLLMPALLLIGCLTLLLIGLLATHTLTSAAQGMDYSAEPLDPNMVKAGKVTFLTVCAACHGALATGIHGLGKPLVGSAFFNSHSDAELLDFLHTGRPVTDPLNTTGVVMPARGGRLSLTDTDLLNVIAYIRNLNQFPPQSLSASVPG